MLCNTSGCTSSPLRQVCPSLMRSLQRSVSGWVSAALEDRIRLDAAQVGGEVPITHAGVLGRVWRGAPPQARLSQALGGIEVVALDEPRGRAAGRLLGRAGMSDVIDAAAVLLARDCDEIVTVDRSDIETLAAASGRHVELMHP